MSQSLEDIMAGVKSQAAQRKAVNIRPKKPLSGKNRYRILPGWDSENPNQFFQYFGQHWVKDAAGNVTAVAVCLDKTFMEDCPVCNLIRQGIRAANSDELADQLKDANAQLVHLVNAVHVDGPEPTTPFVLSLPATVFEQLSDLISEYGAIFDPKEGYDIVIERKGAGLKTKYSVMIPKDGECELDPSVPLDELEDLGAFANQDKPGVLEKAADEVLKITGFTAAAPAIKSEAPSRAAIAQQLQEEEADDAEILLEDDAEIDGNDDPLDDLDLDDLNLDDVA